MLCAFSPACCKAELHMSGSQVNTQDQGRGFRECSWPRQVVGGDLHMQGGGKKVA